MSSIAPVEEAEALFSADNEAGCERDNEESESLHPELKKEDEKLQKKVNRIVRKKRNMRYGGYKKKSRTADSYLNTESRQALAKALQDKARSHKIVRVRWVLLFCNSLFSIHTEFFAAFGSV